MNENKVSPAPVDGEEERPPLPLKAIGAGGCIQAGDYVFHRPSGERWVLLGVDTPGDRVCAAGWPATVGKLSDCELVLGQQPWPIDNEARRHRRQAFGGGWDDDRADEARMDLEWAL